MHRAALILSHFMPVCEASGHSQNCEGWNQETQNMLRKLNARLSPRTFIISKEEFEDLRKEFNLPEIELLRLLAANVTTNSLCPVSKFRVGAAALCESGDVYLGVNVEFGGLPLFYSIHAEQFTINRVATFGEKIKTLAVNVVPCGHCRQFLNELVNAESLKIVVGNSQERNLDYFLKESFGPRDILSTQDRLLSSTPHTLSFVDSPSSNPSPDPNFSEIISMKYPLMDAKLAILRESALEAAERSYSIYTNSPSGVALMTKSGAIHTGSYIECAAYNPSLSPIHSALINLWADETNEGENPVSGKPKWEEITHAVLVEKEGATISQLPILNAVHAAIFPTARIHVFYTK